MSTIKNGKYGDAEVERLSNYDHPEYGKAARPTEWGSTDKSGPALKSRGGGAPANDAAGSWRRGVNDADDY
jgi:hypothetical protein